MLIFKDKQNKLHFIDSVEFLSLLPNGCVQITEEEAKSLLPKTDLAAEIRAARVPLLDAADKAINKAEDNGLNSAAWRQYRQALRDITTQEGFPDNVKWPLVPA